MCANFVENIDKTGGLQGYVYFLGFVCSIYRFWVVVLEQIPNIYMYVMKEENFTFYI